MGHAQLTPGNFEMKSNRSRRRATRPTPARLEPLDTRLLFSILTVGKSGPPVPPPPLLTPPADGIIRFFGTAKDDRFHIHFDSSVTEVDVYEEHNRIPFTRYTPAG